jgi:SRSO17 transposase
MSANLEIHRTVRAISIDLDFAANLPAKTELRTLAATIKARWICEQAYQQMKEELGLDHFEGRSWQGLHRHALNARKSGKLAWTVPVRAG